MGVERVGPAHPRADTIKAPAYLIALALTLAALATACIAFPHLPETIPIRWNIRGEVAGYGSSSTIFLIGPGVMLLQVAIFTLLPRIAPKRFLISPFMETWLDLMLIIVAMTGYFFAVILVGVLRVDFTLDRAIFAGVALMFVLVGNLLGKIRRNFFFGIRTPWSLVSESTWNATHRMAARTMVAGGVIGLAIVLAGAPLWAMSIVLFISLVMPVAYSYFLYQEERRNNRA